MALVLVLSVEVDPEAAELVDELPDLLVVDVKTVDGYVSLIAAPSAPTP